MKNTTWYRASMVGKAGEYAVAAQLMMRDVRVYFPASDYGVDLLTQEGCRIQVKSAHVSATEKMIAQHGEGAYIFPLPKHKRVAVSDSRSVRRSKPSFVVTCDFVVFWGIEQNRFWIVPAAVCDQSYLFALGRTSSKTKFVGKIEDLREMLSLGYTQTEIARKYGMHRASISALLSREGFYGQKADVVASARACENDWDAIVNFGSTEPKTEPLAAEVTAIKET